MPNRDITVRFSTQDAELVERALLSLGEKGERALKRLGDASREAGVGYKALSAASAGLQGEIDAQVGRFGVLGDVMRAVGPAGAAAGVALGAATAALIGFNNAAADVEALVDTADKLGISTERLQAYRFAAEEAGIETGAFDTALQRFFRRLGEANEGTGVLSDTLVKLGISTRDSNGHLRDQNDVLLDYFDAIGKASTQTERLTLANKAFDTEGVDLVRLAKDGAAGFLEQANRARELGLVFEDDLLRSAAETRRELEVVSEVTEAQLNKAFLQAGPAISAVTGFLGDLAGVAGQVVVGLGAIADRFGDIEDAGSRALQIRLDQLLDRQRELLEEETRFATGTRSPLEQAEDALTGRTIEAVRGEYALLRTEILAVEAALGALNQELTTGGDTLTRNVTPALAAFNEEQRKSLKELERARISWMKS